MTEWYKIIMLLLHKKSSENEYDSHYYDLIQSANLLNYHLKEKIDMK